MLGGLRGSAGAQADRHRGSVEGGEGEHFKQFVEQRKLSLHLEPRPSRHDPLPTSQGQGVDDEVQAMLSFDDYAIAGTRPIAEPSALQEEE